MEVGQLLCDLSHNAPVSFIVVALTIGASHCLKSSSVFLLKYVIKSLMVLKVLHQADVSARRRVDDVEVGRRDVH